MGPLDATTVLSLTVFSSLTRVSAQWQQYLKSIPALWTKLDFSSARKMVPRSAVQKYLNWSKCNATEVVINRFVTPQDRLLPHFARICRPLKTLRIDSGSPNESLIKAVSIPENLRTLILSRDCETTTDCVCQVLSQCPSLIRAEFQNINYPVNARRLPWPADMLKLQILKLHLGQSRGSGGTRFNMALIVGSSSMKIILSLTFQ